MFKEPKEIMSKELKESLRTMSHQIKHISNEIETKNRQKEIQELKSIIAETKNSTEGLDHRFEQAEERLGEPKDGSIEIIQFKEQEYKERR